MLTIWVKLVVTHKSIALNEILLKQNAFMLYMDMIISCVLLSVARISKS